MLRKAYEDGKKAVLERFKLSNLMAGAAAYNPALNPTAAGGIAAPTPAAAPMAGGAAAGRSTLGPKG